MKTRLIESLPGVLPDSLEIHGEQDEDQDESGVRMMFIENLILTPRIRYSSCYCSVTEKTG